MRVFSILFFILISVCLGAAANTDKSKYARLSALESNGVVTVNDDLYMDLILRGNRDYDAFLLYTTVGNRYHCTLCPAANREFALVAKAYSKLEEKAEKNVLFIRVPIDTAPKVFQYHNINTAPIITFLSSNDALGKKLNTNNDFQVEYPVRAENIASYARSKIHVLINIYRFPWPQVIIASLFVFGLPLAAYIYLFHYKKVYDWLSNYHIYLTISLLIYGVAITGIVYDIIHGPPFMSCNQYGCSIFMNQQNQQTVAEGLITGCFCMIIDGVIIIVIGCAYCSIQLIEYSRTKPDAIYRNIIIFGICFCLYFVFFCIRTPWYPQVFTYKG